MLVTTTLHFFQEAGLSSLTLGYAVEQKIPIQIQVNRSKGPSPFGIIIA